MWNFRRMLCKYVPVPSYIMYTFERRGNTLHTNRNAYMRVAHTNIGHMQKLYGQLRLG
jgi:hypothetical protein